MQHDKRCFDCLLSRVHLEIDLVNPGKKESSGIVSHAEEMIRFLHKTPWTHPVVASALHRSIYRRLGVSDPFFALKQASDEVSIEIMGRVAPRLTGFREHILASVIGNMFDYGVKGHEVSDDFVTYF